MSLLDRVVFVFVLFIQSTSVMSSFSSKFREKGVMEENYVVQVPIPEKFSIENVIRIYDDSQIKKSEEELLAHFEQVEQQMEEVQKSIDSISSEIEKLHITVGYFRHEEAILEGLATYGNYVSKPNDKTYEKLFFEQAVTLPKHIRALMKGLLGKYRIKADLMVEVRRTLKCHGRQLQEKINSIMRIVMTGIWLHYEYRQLVEAIDLDDDNSLPFHDELVELSTNITVRLDKEVFQCRMDERNIANEMTTIIHSSSKKGREYVTETLLHFLDDKYDTKKWIVVVSPETGDSSNVYAVQSAGFHIASANGMYAAATSFDPAPELSHKINVHMKNFKFPIESKYEIKIGYSLRDKESARDVYNYLNRYLSPLRTNRSEVVIESLVVETPCTPTEKKFKDFVTVLSSNDTDYIAFNNNGSCIRHLVIIVPVRPLKSNSTALQDLECFHDGVQNGLLRNEFGQAYMSVLNDSSEEAASVVLDREWRNRTGQIWRFVNNQLVNDHGKCLTASAWLLTKPSLYQYDCNSFYWTGQLWYRRGLNIVNGYNLCLAYKGTKDDPIMYLVQAQCDSTAPFLWYDWDVDCEDAMILPSIGNTSRPLKNEFSRLFLTVYEGGFYALNEPWNNEAGQNWQFVDRQLTNDNGKCLIGKGNYVLQADCPSKTDPKSLWTYNEKQQIVSDEGYCLSVGNIYGYILYNYCKDDSEFRWL